jgi:hypothetical protein
MITAVLLMYDSPKSLQGANYQRFKKDFRLYILNLKVEAEHRTFTYQSVLLIREAWGGSEISA